MHDANMYVIMHTRTRKRSLCLYIWKRSLCLYILLSACSAWDSICGDTKWRTMPRCLWKPLAVVIAGRQCTFTHSHIPIFSHSHILTFSHSHIPTFSHSHIPTFTHSHMHAFSHMHAYLRISPPDSWHLWPQESLKNKKMVKINFKWFWSPNQGAVLITSTADVLWRCA